ncbi:MAG: hypothetical protein DME97_08875 [Verrucomicrobia bacterium]|nr:MAG: hypothetical protein DME97_08875 [Verrucomicrobiota bacterium]
MKTNLRTQFRLAVWISPLVLFGLSHSHGSDLADYVATMDKKTTQIDRLPTREVKKSLLTGTDRGGTLSAFWHEGQIRHVKVTIGMSNRWIEENYYYENGQLIFVASKQSFFLWDKDAHELDPRKIANSLEDRYYFVDGKLKQWNTNRAAADLSSQNSNIAKENETVLRESSFFMQTARDEKDSIDIEGFIKRGTP